jgi:hypothetical protein
VSRHPSGPRRTPPAQPGASAQGAGAPAAAQAGEAAVGKVGKVGKTRPTAPAPRKSASASASTPAAAAAKQSEPALFEPGRHVLAASYAFGVLAGVVLGLYGVFAVPAGPRLGTTLLSLGVALATVGNIAVAVFVRWLAGTRLGATIVLLGWVPTVVWLGTARPEGDVVLQATANGYLFLGLGAVAPMAVAVLGQPRRGLTSLPPRWQTPS